MLSKIVVFAPAKINLGLKVLPKRQDGFHNLESIFQTVSLADKLTVSEFSGSGCTVTCEDMELPENNTISNAYKAFCSVTGISGFAVKVILEKHIPAGGGLGGGSSDAVAFIRALEKLKGIRLSEKQLDSIASEVGSDVFFFTYALSAQDGKRFSKFEPFAAVVEGRGEKVRQIQHRSDFSVLLVFPNVSVSTKDAYALVDETLDLERRRNKISLEEIYNLPVKNWSFRNDFTVPVSEKYAGIAEALIKLKSCGADFADMSGSGSTVFGIFEKKETALKAKVLLEKEFNLALCLGG